MAYKPLDLSDDELLALAGVTAKTPTMDARRAIGRSVDPRHRRQVTAAYERQVAKAKAAAAPAPKKSED